LIPGFATFTPTDKTYSVQVTNNQFYFAIRQAYNGFFPFISAWKLTFDSRLGTTATDIRGKVNIKGKAVLR
jgi:hypothetical protein